MNAVNTTIHFRLNAPPTPTSTAAMECVRHQHDTHQVRSNAPQKFHPHYVSISNPLNSTSIIPVSKEKLQSKHMEKQSGNRSF